MREKLCKKLLRCPYKSIRQCQRSLKFKGLSRYKNNKILPRETLHVVSKGLP